MDNETYLEFLGKTDSEKLVILVGMVDGFLASGVAYNSDYNDIKENINRILDQDDNRWNDIYISAPGHPIGATRAIGMTYIHQIPGRIKALDAYEKAYGQAQDSRLRDVLEAWLIISKKMTALKSITLKGRKPSTTPRVTPVRTLENTGTCSVCDQNVKIEGDGLYHHGFKVKWNERMGVCPGTGKLPWEVSTQGADAYLARLKVSLSWLQELLLTKDSLEQVPAQDYPTILPKGTTYATKDLPLFTRAVSNWEGRIRSQIRNVQADIAYYEKRNAEWAPAPLPGSKVGDIHPSRAVVAQVGVDLILVSPLACCGGFNAHEPGCATIPARTT